MDTIRITPVYGVDRGQPVRIVLRSRPCPRCHRIHLPATALLAAMQAAGGKGAFALSAPIVIGSCQPVVRETGLLRRLASG